jgi:hypothetical protein
MGLSVSKNIIENMGGGLWFTSKLNVGTMFSFAVPMHLEEVDELDPELESHVIKLVNDNLSQYMTANIVNDFNQSMKDLTYDDRKDTINFNQTGSIAA